MLSVSKAPSSIGIAVTLASLASALKSSSYPARQEHRELAEPATRRKTTGAVSDGGAPPRRAPRQARSLHKVELILEAAVRLIDRSGMESVTTNALARTAGISIGTLYQYFPDKETVVEALIDREMVALSERLIGSFASEPPGAPGERVRLVVRAVLDAYGSRKRAHRALLLYAMNRGDAGRLDDTLRRLAERLSSGGLATPRGLDSSVPTADAFVLTYAIGGVLRAMLAVDKPPPRDAIEDALIRMVIGFWPHGGAA